MIPLNKLRKWVLVYSMVPVALLLWLSMSFLLVAESERLDARFQTRFLKTDRILRNAAMALAQERSTSYWLTGIDGLFFPEDSLSKTRITTDNALQSAISELRLLQKNDRYAASLRFQLKHLNRLVNTLIQQAAELEQKRTSLAYDLKYPADLRDNDLQSEVLDYYRKLVQTLETVRHGTSYVTSRQSRSTQSVFDISDAAWNIALSNELLTALFEGYITSGNTAQGKAYRLAIDLHGIIKNKLQTINQIDAYANIDPDLHSLSVALNDWSADSYHIPMNKLTQALANRIRAPYSISKWREITEAMENHTLGILQRADELSRSFVTETESRAKRNLLIDAILVVLCIFLTVCAFWIVKRMHYQAMHDELTGIANRRYFKTHSEVLLENTSADKQVSLLKLDLYKFKAVNDSFGQIVGDKLLQQVASLLQSNTSSDTKIARLGGDEFAVLIDNCNRVRARFVAENLARILSTVYEIEGQTIQLGLCIGFASYPQDANNSEELLKAANMALNEAKQAGRGSILRYEASIATAFQERQKMEAELTLALENNQFELHYQPQFDLETSAVEGVEALIRWQHPERGMVSPFHFIPLAEEAGLLPAIGRWVITEAVQQAARWRDVHGLQLRMSVNVSVHQFLHGDLVSYIKKALSHANLEPCAFEIEITESVAMADVSLVIDILNELHELGIRIALDDFGTGYSSLSYLQDLPLDTLKIDRSFIVKIDNGTRTQQLLLESIASMAQLLNFHTVAEGVETDTQLSHIKALGIDTVQGYYYSKPVSGEQIPADVEAIDFAHRYDAHKAA